MLIMPLPKRRIDWKPRPKKTHGKRGTIASLLRSVRRQNPALGTKAVAKEAARQIRKSKR